MNVRLAYGREGIELQIPENLQVDVLEPEYVPGLPDQPEAIRRALRNPVDSDPLASLVAPGDRIGIIFSDITRATPYHTILPVLLQELSHVPDENIILFCATGTHRPASGPELETILGKEIAERFRIVQNDPNDPSLFTLLGSTASGNEIWINSELVNCDLKILTGFIEPHFFMGFSGGGKAIMPGMALLSSIRHNHSIRMLEHENAGWGITEGNPLWEDVREASEMLTNLFLLNITMNREKNITGVFAGNLRSAHSNGCDFARKTAMVPVDKPYDLVITSNAGYPLDLNVYQSVKGMSAAAQVVREGGEILLFAECWDGIPSGSDYEGILMSSNSVGELDRYIRDHEYELQDTWQVFFQVRIQQKAKVYLYSDKLDDRSIRKALLVPVNDPATLIEDIIGRNGTQPRICVLPEGPQTIPYLINDP